MASSVALLGCGVLILLGIYKYFLHPAFLSPLARIPAANFSARFSPLWINYIRWANLENNTLYQLHRRLGPIVRLGPSELSVDCYEEGLDTIYGAGFPKTEFYKNKFAAYGTENAFTIIDKKQHFDRKRLFSNVYSKSVILASPTIKATTESVLYDRLLPAIQEAAKVETPINVHRLNFAYAMDSFMAYQFGLSLGSDFIRDIATRNWYLDSFFSRRRWAYWVGEHPRFIALASKLGLHIVPKWCSKVTNELESWQIDICDKAEDLISSRPNIASTDPANYPAVFATERAQYQKADGKTWSNISPDQPYPRRLELASEMYDHNAAALETSGITLTYVYYELSRRPELQSALRTELLTLDPPITFSSTLGSSLLPDPKSIDALPLLDAILQETLRRWAAVPGPQPRCTPPEGCSLAGNDNIPGGVRVSCLAYSLHRNPDVFPDPLEWKPERWLDATPEELKEMRHWFWAWGSGRTMCSGLHFATHSMKHAIAAIYTNFTTEIVDAEGIEQAEGWTAGPIGDKLVLTFKKV